MKRTKVGGSLAAVANKHGIGKVVARFPPVALLTDEERAQALAVMRKGRAVKRDAREKEARDASEAEAMRAWDAKGTVPGNEPAPAPIASGPAVAPHISLPIPLDAYSAEIMARNLVLISADTRASPDLREEVLTVLRSLVGLGSEP